MCVILSLPKSNFGRAFKPAHAWSYKPLPVSVLVDTPKSLLGSVLLLSGSCGVQQKHMSIVLNPCAEPIAHFFVP